MDSGRRVDTTAGVVLASVRSFVSRSEDSSSSTLALI